MILHEHKRICHGQQPGDLPRRMKIAMREGRVPFWAFPWQRISIPQAKAFRDYLRQKGRSVQRRRDRKAIQDGLRDD